MARKRLPVITPQDINAVQLSPRLRRILAHRARAFATRQFKPAFQGLQAERAAIREAGQEQMLANRGATTMSKQSLAAQIRGLKATGLKGDYLQQAKAELLSRKGDATSALPFLNSQARSELQADLLENRMSFIDTKTEQKQAAVTDLQSAVNKAYTAGASKLKAEATERKENRDKREANQEGIRNALIKATALYQEGLKASGTKVKDPTTGKMVTVRPPQTDADWLKFAASVSAEGADHIDAVKAIAILRKRIARETRKVARPYARAAGDVLGQLFG